MTTKRATPKKQRLENMPDTCGSCLHAHDVSGQEFLLCYVLPPVLLVGEDGQAEWQQRGSPVESGDPRCHFFSPKCRA